MKRGDGERCVYTRRALLMCKYFDIDGSMDRWTTVNTDFLFTFFLTRMTGRLGQRVSILLRTTSMALREHRTLIWIELESMGNQHSFWEEKK
jgi:hypothetical protein